MSTTITLRKPLEIAGEVVSELTLREPLGGDIRRCGIPFTVKAGDVVIDSEAIAKYISVLAVVPPSTVDKLSAPDFLDCQNAVMLFFSE